MFQASVARVPVGWVEARPDGGFGHGLSRAETHHLEAGIVDDGLSGIRQPGKDEVLKRVEFLNRDEAFDV